MEVKEFPIETQLRVFKDEQEIANYVLTSDITEFQPLDYCFIAYAPFIFTPFVQECLERYEWMRRGHTSFSNNYDDLPAWWVETVTLIDTEIDNALTQKRKDGGN